MAARSAMRSDSDESIEEEVSQWSDDSGETMVRPTQPARHRPSRPEWPKNTNLSTSWAGYIGHPRRWFGQGWSTTL